MITVAVCFFRAGTMSACFPAILRGLGGKIDGEDWKDRGNRNEKRWWKKLLVVF